MALKQPADQSSLYLDWYASNAVDGKVDVRDDHDSQRATCTHTNSYRGPTWWTVTFSKPVYVYVFLIHNRRGSGDGGKFITRFTCSKQKVEFFFCERKTKQTYTFSVSINIDHKVVKQICQMS